MWYFQYCSHLSLCLACITLLYNGVVNNMSFLHSRNILCIFSEYFVGSAHLWKIAAHYKQCVSILSRSLGPTRMDSLRGSLDSYLIVFFNATCTLYSITQGPCPIVLCFSYVLWSHIFLKYCTRLCAVYVYILFSGQCILREYKHKIYLIPRCVKTHIVTTVLLNSPRWFYRSRKFGCSWRS